MQNYPYSDKDMVYDYDKHRYILTEECVLRECRINLAAELRPTQSNNPADEVNAFLDEVSFEVYNFVFSHAFSKDVAEYRCAKNPGLRTPIKEAMLKQVRYKYVNGAIGDEAGINFQNGTAMRLDDIRGERTMSPYTVSILTNAGLLYRGKMLVPAGVKFREGY
jgi:hypothetical protein